NVDRETNRRVAAEGFTAVTVAEREGVGEPAPASLAYRDRLLSWFKRHTAGGGGQGADPARFERFVRAQLFWDRAMAEALANAHSGGQQPLVIGIMGSGHIEYGDGIAHQLAALGLSDVAAALPWSAGDACPVTDRPVADVLFGIASPRDGVGR
ncbi:MAG: ChaN family lipoprotein, partial [Deltaproteobacteria bacterium]|nr:ChaN family lipoprotein [Deltaproteobacteria bacterium]